MGYYTRYRLEIVKGNDNQIDYHKEISELSGYGNCFEDIIKWYSHEEDMRILSKNHPETLFMLKGEGEESGDLWAKYFLNGKMQVCRAVISYADYDERLLK